MQVKLALYTNLETGRHPYLAPHCYHLPPTLISTLRLILHPFQ